MKEKLLFLGMLIMCVLYYVEVLPTSNLSTLNIIGFVISAITIVPWLISMLVGYKKKREEKELKESKKNK